MELIKEFEIMIKEDNLTKQIFLTLIENSYYKDNKQLLDNIQTLKAFKSKEIMTSDGKIEQTELETAREETLTYLYTERGEEEAEKKEEQFSKKPLFATEKSIFEDLNYGDFVLVCPNPLYHYQIPERIRGLENILKNNPIMKKTIKFTKKIKIWLKDLNKVEGINLENIKVDSLFSKYDARGNQVMDRNDISDDVIKSFDIKQVKSTIGSCKPKSAWISLKRANDIYDECLGCNRGTSVGDGKGDDCYYGLKDLDL